MSPIDWGNPNPNWNDLVKSVEEHKKKIREINLSCDRMIRDREVLLAKVTEVKSESTKKIHRIKALKKISSSHRSGCQMIYKNIQKLKNKIMVEPAIKLSKGVDHNYTKNQVSEMIKEISRLISRKVTYEARIESNQVEILSLTEEANSLGYQLKELKTTLETLSIDISSEKAMVRKLSRRLDTEILEKTKVMSIDDLGTRVKMVTLVETRNVDTFSLERSMKIYTRRKTPTSAWYRLRERGKSPRPISGSRGSLLDELFEEYMDKVKKPKKDE